MRGNNLDSVRRNNLAMVLEIVNRTRAVSRSELTRATGLNRSTVAALVNELADLELIVEAGPDVTTSVGRPSPIVSPHPNCVAIAVNPELDAVTIGIVGLGGVVFSRIRRDVDHVVTPTETVSIVERMLRSLESELVGKRVVGLGIAVPGLVRASDGLVRWAPHLDWTDEPITDRLEEATGYPAVAGNDASLGAVAEHMYGAGIGVSDLIYLNGGASGIGGGVIAGGAPLGGVGGYAGEFGQNRPGVRDPSDRRTTDGTLEDEVSRARLLDVVGLASADEPELASALLGSTDPAVEQELLRQVRVLSVALSNAINVLNPEMVVLGGFLAPILASHPETLTALVADQSIAASYADVRVVPAALGEDLLLIGAAQLIFESVLADPASYGAEAAERSHG